MANAELKQVKARLKGTLLIGDFHFSKERGKDLVIELPEDLAKRFVSEGTADIVPDDTPITHEFKTGKKVSPAPIPDATESTIPSNPPSEPTK